MVERYFTRAATCARRRVGPLSAYIADTGGDAAAA
jgi:hypothetical protein